MTAVERNTRRDYQVGPMHLIVRTHSESPQYGVLLWGGYHSPGRTFDVWVRRTLITLRVGRKP